MTNPWNVTARQSESMDAYIEHFSEKAAAAALGVSIRTLSTHLTRARMRMQAATRLEAVLMWDRWKHSMLNTAGRFAL